MSESGRILIVGSSTRAAARSALDCGFVPVCGDLFGDADLHEMCRAEVVHDYPTGFRRLFESTSFDGWMFTGALENHPSLIEEWSARGCHWGPTANSLRQVRDPFRVHEVFKFNGIQVPSVAISLSKLNRQRAVLRKPLKSAGGSQVRFADSKVDSAEAIAGYYFQEFIRGLPHSAVYVAAGQNAELLGVTQQLIGTNWCGVQDFRYAGSIGPIYLSDAEERQWIDIGRCVANEFDLCGLFGVDAVVNQDGVWPVEINPRYTASVEILERANSECRSITRHVRACRDRQLAGIRRSADLEFHGKAIVFAEAACEIESEIRDQLMSWMKTESPPILGDVPDIGLIPAGRPIATVFARGPDKGRLLERLESRVMELRARCRHEQTSGEVRLDC